MYCMYFKEYAICAWNVETPLTRTDSKMPIFPNRELSVVGCVTFQNDLRTSIRFLDQHSVKKCIVESIKTHGSWGRLARTQLFLQASSDADLLRLQDCCTATQRPTTRVLWNLGGLAAHVHADVNSCCKYLKQEIFVFRNIFVNLCGLFIHLSKIKKYIYFCWVSCIYKCLHLWILLCRIYLFWGCSDPILGPYPHLS